MRNKAVILVLVVSLVFNAALLYLFMIRGENVGITDDNRIVIRMSDQSREHIMTEMRTFLESIRHIQQGIASDNRSQIELVGNESGNCRMEHVPKGLLRTLPLGFKKLGMNTHDLFDDIARSAKEDYNKKIMEEKLSRILTNCTTCHSTYQITAY